MKNNLIEVVKQSNLTIEYLNDYIKNGGKLNVVDRNGRSALIWSILNKNINNIKLLIECGIDVNLIDKRGRNAIKVAVNINYYNGFELLINSGENIQIESSLHHLVRFKKTKWIKLIFNRGIKWSNNRLLLLASYLGHLEIVKIFIENGININIVDHYGKNALNYANDRYIRYSVIKYLIENGIDIKNHLNLIKNNSYINKITTNL